MNDDDPLAAFKGIFYGLLLTLLFWGIIALSAALAEPNTEWKAPPPLPRQDSRSCLYVYNKPRCIRVEPEVLLLWDLKPGQSVTPLTMIEIDEENKKFQSEKLR